MERKRVSKPAERELETCGERVRNLWRERELAKPAERELANLRRES